MVITTDGGAYIVPDEVAEKLRRYDMITEILEAADPFHGNRYTCDRIREIVGKGTDTAPAT